MGYAILKELFVSCSFLPQPEVALKNDFVVVVWVADELLSYFQRIWYFKSPIKNRTLVCHSLILDFVYAHRAGWNGQIGSAWLPWKMFVYAVLFWAKKG